MTLDNRPFQILAVLTLGFLSACSVFQRSLETEHIEKVIQPIDSLSYALGSQIGASLLDQGFVDIDPADLQKSMQDAMSGTEPLFDQKTAIAIIDRELQKQLAEELEAKKRSVRLFLEDKDQESDITKLESGLLYEVLWEGDSGERPITVDLVKVQIEGRLLDGKVFESTYKNGRPVILALKEQITGLREGLRLMRPGAKYKFHLPPRLAYGETGNGVIGAWEVLVYEVELIEVIKEP